MSLRTPRTIARSHGAKVPPKPQAAPSYCSVHGMLHAGGCNYAAPDAEAEVAQAGGKAPGSSPRPTPFKGGR